MTDTPENQDPLPLYSHHIFIFPFKWDYLPKGKNILDTSYSQRTNLKDLENVMEANSNWDKSSFKIVQDHQDRYHTFNEYNYFYEYARDALAIDFSNQETALRFQYRPVKIQTSYYEITTATFTSDDPKEAEYRLEIRDIILTWYDTGIGFLAFFLENRQTDKPLDILRINDFGRRLYPQFLGYVPENIKDARSKKPLATAAPQYSFLAKNIRLVIGGQPIEEDFGYYNSLASLNGNPIQLPNHIRSLLGPTFQTVGKESAQRNTQPYILLTPVIDDRMFVLCFYMKKSKMNRLVSFNKKAKAYAYTNNKFWYAYLFIDPNESITCQSQTMQEALAKQHTYDRWIGNKNSKGEAEGHLFGITRYSFMILANPCWFSENILINHHRYLYFQMSALALMQRASILRFAKEAARISQMINSKKNLNWQKTQIREVYAAYLNFTNKVYFREITPQEQGIELYDKLRKVMEIDADLLALQREIDELHRYALLLEGEKSSREAELLSGIAAIFLPPTLIASIFGFSNFPSKYLFWDSFWLWLMLSITLPIIAWGIMKLWKLTQK